MKHDLFTKVRVYPNLKPLKDYMRVEYIEMQEEKSDRFVVVAGYEGSCKSYLQLDLHEFWTMDVLGETDIEKAFSTFCFKDVDWGKALVASKQKPFMMISHDEAVNILYRKEGATKKNKAVNKAFKKFRGKRWYHCMLIPQVHRLDKEMVEDRVKRLLFVFKFKEERFVAVYSKKRVDSLIAEINRMIDSTARDVKSRPQVLNCDTDPIFICKIPMYKGKLLKLYESFKEDNMDDSVDEVAAVLQGDLDKEVKKLPENVLKDTGIKLIHAGKQVREVMDLCSVSERTVRRWIKSDREKQSIE